MQQNILHRVKMKETNVLSLNKTIFQSWWVHCRPTSVGVFTTLKRLVRFSERDQMSTWKPEWRVVTTPCQTHTDVCKPSVLSSLWERRPVRASSGKCQSWPRRKGGAHHLRAATSSSANVSASVELDKEMSRSAPLTLWANRLSVTVRLWDNLKS